MSVVGVVAAILKLCICTITSADKMHHDSIYKSINSLLHKMTHPQDILPNIVQVDNIMWEKIKLISMEPEYL